MAMAGAAALPSAKTLRPIPSLPLLQLKPYLLNNPNPNFLLSSPPLRRSSSLRWRIRCGTEGVMAQTGFEFERERGAYDKPASIPWRKDIANSVQFIGIVGTPVQIKYVTSGKVLAWTRLGVKNSSTETTWISLTFWDELAHTAYNHLEKGQQIYVSGRLVSDSVEGDENKRQVYYKVVVQQLNFIEKNLPQVPLYEPVSNNSIKGNKMGNYNANQGSSSEELWQAFFASPLDWWDNRKNKKNPKGPDFKHKDTGEALWIEGRYNPPWVKSQLAKLDSKMRAFPSNDANSSMFIPGGDISRF